MPPPWLLRAGGCDFQSQEGVGAAHFPLLKPFSRKGVPGKSGTGVFSGTQPSLFPLPQESNLWRGGSR